MTVDAPRLPGYRQPDPKYMTFVEHLQELRQRLIVCAIAIAAGSVGGWILAGRVIKAIDQPLCHSLGSGHCKLILDTIYGGFTLQLKVAIVVGFAFALPVTIYQMWGFVAPAFGTGPNRWAPVWMLSALLLFVGGAATGWLFAIPIAVNFFAKFQGPSTEVLPFASQYVGFVILFLLIFGISFELPLVLVSLTAAGITSSQWLASKRIYFFFGIFAVATVVTPGVDWISPLILGGVLYVLYELSLLVSRLLGK